MKYVPSFGAVSIGIQSLISVSYRQGEGAKHATRQEVPRILPRSTTQVTVSI